MDNREHQDFDIGGTGFPIRPIQSQRGWPRNAKHFDDKHRKLGIRQIEIHEKPMEPFVIRLFFGSTGKRRRQNRQIDSPGDEKGCQKSREKFDAGLVPR